jgi:hypothetical protein
MVVVGGATTLGGGGIDVAEVSVTAAAVAGAIASSSTRL